MGKHTPGPWQAPSTGIYAGEYVGNTVIGPMIASCGTAQITRDLRKSCAARGTSAMEETHANALLIAAAPEMYEALETLLNCIDPARDWKEAKAARAALKKARNE